MSSNFKYGHCINHQSSLNLIQIHRRRKDTKCSNVIKNSFKLFSQLQSIITFIEDDTEGIYLFKSEESSLSSRPKTAFLLSQIYMWYKNYSQIIQF